MCKLFKNSESFLALVLLVILTGCGSSNGTPGHKTGGQGNGVNDVLNQQMKKEDAEKGVTPSATPTAAPTPTPTPTGSVTPTGIAPGPDDTGTVTPTPAAEATPTPTGSGDDSKIDVDLTQLSSTIVYSEVYNMMTVPDGYIGCTVKMRGSFDVFVDDVTNKYYYACIIQDATACCASGIEFEPADVRVYPDDFPELGSEICVVGVFDTYVEGEYLYCTLRNAKILE